MRQYTRRVVRIAGSRRAGAMLMAISIGKPRRVASGLLRAVYDGFREALKCSMALLPLTGLPLWWVAVTVRRAQWPLVEF